jgi:hypothetical protein
VGIRRKGRDGEMERDDQLAGEACMFCLEHRRDRRTKKFNNKKSPLNGSYSPWSYHLIQTSSTRLDVKIRKMALVRCTLFLALREALYHLCPSISIIQSIVNLNAIYGQLASNSSMAPEKRNGGGLEQLEIRG